MSTLNDQWSRSLAYNCLTYLTSTRHSSQWLNKTPRVQRNKQHNNRVKGQGPFGLSLSITMDLLGFYRMDNPQADARGRTLNTILSWSDVKLEICHDYIQVVFPLPESSQFAWNAPIVDKRVYEAFNSNNKQIGLQSNLQRAFLRILKFYGFEVPKGVQIQPSAGREDAGIAAEWSDNHDERFANWVRPGHNHLRITRIIRSLRILGRQDLAKILFEAIESVWSSPQYQHQCSGESMQWWSRAYSWPLYSPPQGEEGEVGPGLKWLKRILDTQSLQQATGSTT